MRRLLLRLRPIPIVIIIITDRHRDYPVARRGSGGFSVVVVG